MPDYRAMAREAAIRHGIDPYLFERQINQESGFDPTAGSPAGAEGIAQIVPRWHPGVDPYDPEAALDYAANLMASHLANYNGDWRLALAAYNAGAGAVQQYGGVPPFAETQQYVSAILNVAGGQGGGRLQSPQVTDPLTPDDPSGNPDDPFTGPGIRSDGKLNVPGNIEPWLDYASRQTGVPFDILAAVVYQHSRWSGLTPEVVLQVSQALAAAKKKVPDTETVLGLTDKEKADASYGQWMSAAAIYGSRDAAPGSTSYEEYKAQLARMSGVNGWAIGPDVKLPTGKFNVAVFPGNIGGGTQGGVAGEGFGSAGRRIAGLTADEEDAAHSIADSTFLNIMGRLPTDEEYRNIIKKGMTPDDLKAHLRSQPNPNAPGKTLGQTSDIRALAQKYANDTLGRDASAGEINWLLVNGVPANDLNVGAYYQQIKDHAVWHGDPETWLAAQKNAQTIWNDLGLTGKPDPTFVNNIVDNKLTATQIREQVRAMPAPGHPVGTTVGAVEDTRSLAAKFKGELFTEPVTDAEVQQLMGMSPDQVRAYYRSLPSRNIPGLQAGMAEDYKSIAQQVLKQNGIIDHEPTADEVRLFALQKFNSDQIIQHYGDDPALAARQPGLPYGLSRVDYERQLADYQSALTGSVGDTAAGGVKPPSVGLPEGASATARDQTLIGYAMRRKISSQQFGSVVEKFRQETGRLPNGTELGQRLNRPEDVFVPYRGQVAEPGITNTEAGPTISGTEGRRGTPRPAI